MNQTWYRQILDDKVPHTSVVNQNVDVCIVGAGLAGLTVALELSRMNRRVLVLEAKSVAWGASGRNGGFVAPGFAQGYDSIAKRVGQAQANELYGMSIEGMLSVEENIRDLGIVDAKPMKGIISSCRYSAASALLARQRWLEGQFGYQVEYLDTHSIGQHLTSTAYQDALLDSSAFHFNPLAYARGLADEVRRLGGEISEYTPVNNISARQGQWQIATPGTLVTADDVVIATGGYTGPLVPALHKSYLPIATYVMLTQANPELVATAVTTNCAILDDRRASDYYRVVDNGRRLLWGGHITTRTSEPRSIAAFLHKSMSATYPQLKGLSVDYTWSGLMSYARHQMPQIGQLPDGMWYCTAFGGHGMNTTAIGGRVIAEGITEQSDRYRRFAPFGLAPTFGALGRAAVQGTYWRYQLTDWWRERV